MGQEEIFEWFKVQRMSGCHDYFSIHAVEKRVPALNGDVRRAIVKLGAYDYLEVRVVGWRRYFRARDKYVPGLTGKLIDA